MKLDKFVCYVQLVHNVSILVHALCVCKSAHVLEFFQLCKVIVPFTQEKLNDHLTQYYFCGSNCRGIDVLKQVLESIRNPGGCMVLHSLSGTPAVFRTIQIPPFQLV